MNNDVSVQLYSLIIYLISGMGIGILFDIFRILRKSFKTSDIITYIEDFLFWILTGIFLIILLFVFSDGEIRLYNFIGMIIGTIFYILLISKKFININVIIIKFIKKIINKLIIEPINLLCIILIKVLRPITFFVINLKNTNKFWKNSKKK